MTESSKIIMTLQTKNSCNNSTKDQFQQPCEKNTLKEGYQSVYQIKLKKLIPHPHLLLMLPFQVQDYHYLNQLKSLALSEKKKAIKRTLF